MNQLVTNNLLIKSSLDKLTTAQKKFNRLTKNLQREKQLLSGWKETYDKLGIKHMNEIYPLTQEVDKLRLQLLLHLDKVYQKQYLTRPQNKKLLHIIRLLSEELVDCDDHGQAKIIHDRYSDKSYDDLREEDLNEIRLDIEEMLGIDLGEDFDFKAEDALEKFMGKMEQKAEEERERLSKGSVNKKRKISEKESLNINLESHSLRDVFRRLAKILHPDREQDEQEKIKKSALMQRANIAYEKKNLLALLELQIEVEQADQSNINNITEERLEAYNRLLQNQSNKIKQEIQFVKQRLNYDFSIPLFCKKDVEVFYYFDLQKQELHSIKRELTNNFKDFQDIKQLKHWLREFKSNLYYY